MTREIVLTMHSIAEDRDGVKSIHYTVKDGDRTGHRHAKLGEPITLLVSARVDVQVASRTQATQEGEDV